MPCWLHCQQQAGLARTFAKMETTMSPSSATYCLMHLPHLLGPAANQAQFARVRLRRCASDPHSPERLSLSGKLSEVCLALEQLAARESQYKAWARRA